MSLYSQEAEDLLFGTCAQESNFGTYLLQESNDSPADTIKSPTWARGFFQMEPRTHDDIWKTYLPAQPKITNDMMQVCCFSRKPTYDMMVYNLYYATAMARIFYRRVKDPIPTTLELQAVYYKTHYNTGVGAATVDEYVANYRKAMGEVIKKGK